jgi:hypothetical protein
MPSTVVAQSDLRVGSPTVLEAESPDYAYRCVFEDDGESAYFYALDPDAGDQPIVDALHVYDVAKVVDASRASRVEIIWSSDGLHAALFINAFPHAVFDFDHQRAYCRTGFPPPSEWAINDHSWDDSALSPFA